MTVAHPDPWQWRDLLLREVQLPRTVDETPVLEAVGQVLGDRVRSPEDLPAVPVAAMDGFAVHRADLALGTVTLPVSSEIAARPGAVPALVPGTAARIMTGAPVPAGADVVVEVEATDTDPFGPATRTVSITLDVLPAPLRHIRGPGDEVARGEELARPGDRVGGGLVGLVRALGLRDLPILRPLQVGVVVTGDELAEDRAPGADAGATAGAVSGTGAAAGTAPGTVRESNGAMLGAALLADGARARAFHSGDGHEQLRRALDQVAVHHDLVLTTGGIGHGAFDVVKTLLGERGTGTSRFEHLALRPGGPQGFGHLPDGTPVIHLPGTPVGAFVGYHLFVRPLLAGNHAAPRRVLLGEGVQGQPSRRSGAVHARPGHLRRDGSGREVVDLLPGSRLTPYGRADAIVLQGGPCPEGAVPEGAGREASRRAAGEVTVLILPL